MRRSSATWPTASGTTAATPSTPPSCAAWAGGRRRTFDEAIADTVGWYRDRREWWEPIKSGEYRRYYEDQYGAR